MKMMCNYARFSFDLQHVPCFIHGDKDVHPYGISKMLGTIKKDGIQSDLHTLADRDHCFQRRPRQEQEVMPVNRIWEFMNHKSSIARNNKIHLYFFAVEFWCKEKCRIIYRFNSKEALLFIFYILTLYFRS